MFGERERNERIERENNAKKSLMDFLRFVGNDTIITHNARFDINFINFYYYIY